MAFCTTYKDVLAPKHVVMENLYNHLSGSYSITNVAIIHDDKESGKRRIEWTSWSDPRHETHASAVQCRFKNGNSFILFLNEKSYRIKETNADGQITENGIVPFTPAKIQQMWENIWEMKRKNDPVDYGYGKDVEDFSTRKSKPRFQLKVNRTLTPAMAVSMISHWWKHYALRTKLLMRKFAYTKGLDWKGILFESFTLKLW
jgi:hypothetical protein